MIFVIELVMLFLGGVALLFVNRKKELTTLVGRKLVLWTFFLFISIILNTVQYIENGDFYSLSFTIDEDLIKGVVLTILIIVIIQLLSPTKLIKKLIKIFSEKKKKGNTIETNPNKDLVYSLELRESQFEVFLQAICFISFSQILFVQLVEYLNIREGILNGSGEGLKYISSGILMITVPIIIRQILYYIVKIKNINEKEPSREEERIREKLTRENVSL